MSRFWKQWLPRKAASRDGIVAGSWWVTGRLREMQNADRLGPASRSGKGDQATRYPRSWFPCQGRPASRRAERPPGVVSVPLSGWRVVDAGIDHAVRGIGTTRSVNSSSASSAVMRSLCAELDHIGGQVEVGDVDGSPAITEDEVVVAEPAIQIGLGAAMADTCRCPHRRARRLAFVGFDVSLPDGRRSAGRCRAPVSSSSPRPPRRRPRRRRRTVRCCPRRLAACRCGIAEKHVSWAPSRPSTARRCRRRHGEFVSWAPTGRSSSPPPDSVSSLKPPYSRSAPAPPDRLSSPPSPLVRLSSPAPARKRCRCRRCRSGSRPPLTAGQAVRDPSRPTGRRRHRRPSSVSSPQAPISVSSPAPPSIRSAERDPARRSSRHCRRKPHSGPG